MIQCSCNFFFSSRRRHTRYIGDWSSDVCSSDLVREDHGRWRPPDCPWSSRTASSPPDYGMRRSEERRVGKEWRYQWWPDHYKKKKKMTGKNSLNKVT